MANYDKILDHAILNNLNVLLIGEHGVGKTATIKECFTKHKLNWKYFSAATMDPWVDFIGVPKEKVDDKGVPYLDLVRPKEFAYDEVEALFFDELNRSHKKIRNSIMELIQFKSINGKKFSKLKVVWAAINPHDEDQTYDVDKLDPAQLDRFHLHIDVPYKPDAKYFNVIHGLDGTNAVKWWFDQNPEVKKVISPRRLDYALQVHKTNGDVRYVFNDKKINVSQFLDYLSSGSAEDAIKNLMTRPEAEIKEYLNNNNNYNKIRKLISGTPKTLATIFPNLPDEVKLSYIKEQQQNQNLIKYLETSIDSMPAISSAILANPKSYPKMHTHVRTWLTKSGTILNNIPDGEKINIGGKILLRKDVRIAITGRLNIPRYEIQKLIVKAKCTLDQIVSRKTTYLLYDGTPSSTAKYTNAKNIGTTLLTENEFMAAFDPTYPGFTGNKVSAAAILAQPLPLDGALAKSLANLESISEDSTKPLVQPNNLINPEDLIDIKKRLLKIK